ncbi:MAG: Na/Pi cotransporter family protein [Pseudomonadota bacterium]
MDGLPPLDGWQLLAGLGLFLYGMDRLEKSLHTLAGHSFNRLLRQVTGHPLLSVLFGMVATGILQSSSILGLMVLAFVGAGVLPMRNAIGVILGSNIGSTFTGWIVASIGFSVDVEALALPLVGIGAIAVLFTLAETRRHAWSGFLLACGLLLLGIGYMTSAASDVAEAVDPALLAGRHPLVFFAVGIVVTVLVRTSAATILMALSAMNAGLLTFEQAAAIAIGADLGTTSTMAMAALRGVAAKKQVALFHVLFNAVSNGIALLVLLPHARTITGWYGIDDPLLALPAFHTTINLLGVLLFMPFTARIGDWLEHRFRREAQALAIYLPRVPWNARDAAFTALEQEMRALYGRVLSLNRDALGLTGDAGGSAFGERYDAVKRLEGEILAYVRQIQAQPLSDDEARRLGALQSCAREAVQAAKGVKDVRLELAEFRRDGNRWLQEWLADYATALRRLYAEAEALSALPAGAGAVPACLDRFDALTASSHEALRRRLYEEVMSHGLDAVAVSTLLNVMHEIQDSLRALRDGCRSLLLEA